MASTLIILGSSRRNGNTEAIVNKINKKLKADIINLLDFQISQYDYEHKNRDDDFLPLIRQIIDNYDYIIFATPVYWYAMSGMMKTFFDRFTDLLTIEKDLGRKLKRIKAGVITSSIGDNMDDKFWLPFERIFVYLGMEFLFGRHFMEDDITEADLCLLLDEL